jgi:hypothetical protein
MSHNITIIIDGGLLGDANDDGVVDIFDAQLIAEYNVGLILDTQIPGFDMCDVNDDGVVDIFDANAIADYDIGLPCNCLLD